MPTGTTKVGSFGYVAQVDKDGNVVDYSSASGSKPASQSTSVTPASDGAPFKTTLYDSAGSRDVAIRSLNAGAPLTDVPGLATVSLGTYYFDDVSSTLNLTRGNMTGAFVVSKGGNSIATGQVAVGTSATQIAPARAGRQKITLSPTSATVYYVGPAGVTATSGVYVAAGGTITLDTTAAIFAVGAAALTVSFIEYY